MAVDCHPRCVAIQNLQAFGDIRHTDSRTSYAYRIGRLAGGHANPIILYFDDQTRPGQAAAQVDAAAFHLRGKSVLD